MLGLPGTQTNFQNFAMVIIGCMMHHKAGLLVKIRRTLFYQLQSDLCMIIQGPHLLKRNPTIGIYDDFFPMSSKFISNIQGGMMG